MNERIKELLGQAYDEAVPETWTTLSSEKLGRTNMKLEEMLAATNDPRLWRLIGALWLSEPWYNGWLTWNKPYYRTRAVVIYDRVLTHQENRGR